MNTIIKKRTFALFLTIPIHLSAAEAGIPTSELSIGGISIDFSEEEVRRQLGAPLETFEQADFLTLILRYEKLTVSFNGNNVEELFSDNPQACTPAGLCPTDTLQHAKKLYGEPRLAQKDKGLFWEYYSDCPCWPQLEPRDDRVHSVRVVCTP